MFPKGGFLRTFDMLFTKFFSDQETLKIPFIAISFMLNLRMTGLQEQAAITHMFSWKDPSI